MTMIAIPIDAIMMAAYSTGILCVGGDVGSMGAEDSRYIAPLDNDTI